MALILVRHGQSAGNAAGLLLGRLESPLTEEGRRQAEGLAASVRGAARVLSSPLGRARETAEALGAGAVEVDDRWVEVDYGAWDGQPLGDVPAEVWQAWRRDPGYTPPGGESLASVGLRVRAACAELMEEAEHGGPPTARRADVVVVSHVSPIKAAVCWALGLDDGGAWRLQLSTGSVTRITWGRGGPVLESFNELARPRSG